MRPWGRSIRYTILSIAWFPSLVLLLLGLTITAVLAQQGRQVRTTSQALGAFAPQGAALHAATIGERRLSLLMAGNPSAGTPPELAAVRAKVDAAAGAAKAKLRPLLQEYPDLYGQLDSDINAFVAQLPSQRQRIDDRQLSRLEVSRYYTGMTAAIEKPLTQRARQASSVTTAIEQGTTAVVARATDEFQEADALALSSAVGRPLSPQEYAVFAERVGSFRARTAEVLLLLNPDERAQFQRLLNSPPWRALGQAYDQILLAGPQAGVTPNGAGTRAGEQSPGAGEKREAGENQDTVNQSATAALPLPDMPTWLRYTQQATTDITAFNVGHSRNASKIAADEGEQQAFRSLIVGGGMILLVVVVFLITTLLSNRLVARLRKLQRYTLARAHQQLPSIVARLRDGQPVDLDSELRPIEFGQDEIGQVADAFEEAQRSAVAAAAGEAETRAGLRTVFLDIARRSQIIVHRQLAVLDQAERSQEDPDQLALLFELDHLTTRARRNAENLIILGGRPTGRRWRNPVPLLDITRSAISEAEHYVRVRIASIPAVSLQGTAVTDVIHLLAELVDNATRFSPPMSRVEVRGNLVGRGVVVEVEDQGLGIEPDQLEQLNALLHESPDFQVMALANEPRLGLFVVAQLAARHGIRVTLTPSAAYGGITAVVLLPTELLGGNPELSSRAPMTSIPEHQTTRPAPSLGAAMTVPELFATGPVRTVERPYPPPPNDGNGHSHPSLPAPPGPRLARVDEAPGRRPERRWEAAPLDETNPRGRPAMESPTTPGGFPVSTERGRPAGPGPEPMPDTSQSRPDLPRRTRQAHLTPKLRDVPSAGTGPADLLDMDHDPEKARRRMSALQRGTLHGRATEPEA